MKKFVLFYFLISIFLIENINGQKHKNRLEEDSIFFSNPYPYKLPIMGYEAHKRGYRMQLPFGVMLNALVVRQTLYIDKISVGFGNVNNNSEVPMYDLSEITKFENIKAQTSTYNFRFDIWPLPFLNIYGILGKNRQANINIKMVEPFPLEIQTDIAGWYLGSGMMLNGKIGRFFVSLDTNTNYNHNPRLDKPVQYTLASFRMGPIFEFKNNPQMRLITWTGAMYGHFGADTNGEIRTIDIAPNAPQRIDEMVNRLNEWYDGLTPLQKIKYSVLHNALENGLNNLSNGINQSYIKYSMEKTTHKPWNLLLGVQWQVSDHWQMRTEAQLLGDRIAGLFSFNYRFGIKHK